MLPQEGIDLVIQHIATAKRHAYYDHCLKVKEFATRMITGEDQKEWVTRYRRSENDELKDQRDRLTNTLTQYLLARPRKYWKRVHNVEGVNLKVTATGQDKKLQTLKDNFDLFEDGRNLIEWLNYKLEYLGVTDPNAWIFFERYDQRTIDGKAIQSTTVYPFVAGCEEVINYKRMYNRTMWALVMQPWLDTYVNGGTRMDVWRNDYLLYAPGFSVRFREVGGGRVMESNETEMQVQSLISEGEMYVAPDVKAKVLPEGYKELDYYVAVFDTGTTEIPGMCVGAYPDERTGQKTFVPWFEPARHVLFDVIRDKSLLDVTKIIHAYPKRYEYTKPCGGKHEDGSECKNGYYNADPNRICGTCRGTGETPSFTTEQQAIRLALPKNVDPAKLVELAKLSYTEVLSTDFPKWLAEEIEKAEKRVMNAVLNAGIIERPLQVEKTATQTNLEYEDLNYVLQPFAALLDRFVELGYRVGSQYLEFELTVDRRTPNDLKLQTLNDLLLDLEAMQSAGVSWDIQRQLIERIIAKQNEDNPGRVDAILARYEWLPFVDKAPEEVAMILAVRSPQDDQRVLRENWYEIFREIEAEQPEKAPFHMLKYPMQKAIVMAKVAEFKLRIVPAGDVATDETGGGFDVETAIGKLPLALQQLGLAHMRALEGGQPELAAYIAGKQKELLDKINANAFDDVPGLGETTE
jgi:hypothetical protein